MQGDNPAQKLSSFENFDNPYWKIKLFLYSLEVLRVTGKGDSLNQGRSSENDMERGEDGEKKPRYRTYAGGTVTEEVVKLSEKVVVPVKEYPKVRIDNQH